MIEEVHINPKVTIIKDGAFSGNKSLKKIVLHEHLRKIGKSAFLNFVRRWKLLHYRRRQPGMNMILIQCLGSKE